MKISIFESCPVSLAGLKVIFSHFNTEEIKTYSISSLKLDIEKNENPSANCIFLSTGFDNSQALSILKYLVDKQAQKDYTPVFIRMNNDEPLLKKLFIAFGASQVLSMYADQNEIYQCLYDVYFNPRSSYRRPQLSQREMHIIQRWLSGESVTQIASAINLNIRTISAHKIKGLKKMEVSNSLTLLKLAGQVTLTH